MSTLRSEQDLGENIFNAVQVIHKTYENLEKLFSELDLMAPKFNLQTITPKFLRWKSDNHYSGWMISSFIKLYQSVDSDPIEDGSGLRNGPIYVVDITLRDEYSSIPIITIAKNLYEEGELKEWGRPPAVNEHWGFYYPTRYKEDFKIEQVGDSYRSTPLSKKKEGYWNIKSSIFKHIPLVQVNSAEAIKEKIFKGMMEL